MLKKSIGILLSAALLLSVFAIMGTASASAATGKWELVERRYYVYDKDNTGKQYVSKQNEYYKYVCQYKGTTDDGYVSFSASGGYMGPGTHSLYTILHDCLPPKASYTPDETVTLKVRLTVKDAINTDYKGYAHAFISKYNETEYGDGYFNNNTTPHANFEYYNGANKTTAINKPGTTTVTAKMPYGAVDGEKAAIVFVASSAYDSYSMSKQDDYGGNMFYEWIYQYKASTSTNKTAAKKTTKPAATKITKLKPITKGFKVKWKKIKKAKGYQIQWSSSKKFKKNKTKKALTKSTSGSIIKLKSKKKYYVRVRTYILKNKKKVYSAWSAVVSKKTK